MRSKFKTVAAVGFGLMGAVVGIGLPVDTALACTPSDCPPHDERSAQSHA